jgi:hypothetical protein
VIISGPIVELFVEIIAWLILLDNTISGYLILWKKRKTFGFVLEFVFSFGRVISGVEKEAERRERLFQSRMFMRLFTFGVWVGAIFQVFLSITIIIDVIKIYQLRLM